MGMVSVSGEGEGEGDGGRGVAWMNILSIVHIYWYVDGGREGWRWRMVC
jgi:hypothetical protein